ncbi:aldose 1-epimerase [Sphingobacterium sp. SGG-5]|uniref:aldose 1-epimerase n=1 Tax=Sphingobacterium sp. SGG-5 TaxID=2710881 RepID=UPI0013EC6087|nr:aldose 1-epimerase [Sphingobacterium sp. SGG-5]NGM61804.1 aldose 1-epimerase [Sphingobacterium sp. SGG-5]
MKTRRFIILAVQIIVSFYTVRGNEQSTSNVVIQCPEYRAEINPAYGGNCVRLTHLPTGIEVLRAPKAVEEIAKTPLLYGMPLLFFPNRIRGGRFEFEGRTYLWPINEPERNVAIHGELHHTPFHLVGQTEGQVELEFVATTEQPYLLFPHSFILRVCYRVDTLGLHQEVSVKNTSDSRMPFALAFHTTFNIPFVPGGNVGDVRLRLPVDSEYPRDTVQLVPTGERLTDFPLRDDLREGMLQPHAHILSNFYSRYKTKEMLLTDISSGWSIFYQADMNYNFWMLWNGGRRDLLTIEPQTCLIDALNVAPLTPEKEVITIEPGATVTLKTALGVKKICPKTL